MKNIEIDKSLRDKLPNGVLGVISCSVKVEKSNEELVALLKSHIEQIEKKLEQVPIPEYPNIASTRKAYRVLGKEPTKYRNSAEAMLRRIRQRKGLYYINNVVEVNNLLSINSGFSLGTYDVSAIDEQITWERAKEGSAYEGIGKELLNIEYLPALRDSAGYFGNPTSDSTRAMITEGTREILMIVYSFNGREGLEQLLQEGGELLKKYCYGDNIGINIIE